MCHRFVKRTIIIVRFAGILVEHVSRICLAYHGSRWNILFVVVHFLLSWFPSIVLLGLMDSVWRLSYQHHCEPMLVHIVLKPSIYQCIFWKEQIYGQILLVEFTCFHLNFFGYFGAYN